MLPSMHGDPESSPAVTSTITTFDEGLLLGCFLLGMEGEVTGARKGLLIVSIEPSRILYAVRIRETALDTWSASRKARALVEEGALCVLTAFKEVVTGRNVHFSNSFLMRSSSAVR